MIGPDLIEQGGVSTYCHAVLANYPKEIEFFGYPIGLSKKPLRAAGVLLSLFWKLLSTRKVVHLNTSLNGPAISRDVVFFVAALLARRRVCLFIHGWEYPTLEMLQGSRILRWLTSRLLSRASAICVLCSDFKLDLEALGVKTRILVEPSFYSSDLDLRASHMAVNSPSILFLARIVREKGVFELVDACVALRKEFPGIELHIAGDGPDAQKLKDHVAEVGAAGYVVFHGFVRDQQKSSLLGSVDVFCLPSFFGEGLPISVLDAVYFGLPLVCTDIGGLKDWIQQPENGVIVQPTVDSVAAGLRELLTRPDLQVVRENNKVLATHFEPRKVAGRLADLHSSLA